jgi:hypothetical protein
MKPHPDVAAQPALLLEEPTVSVIHDTRCALDTGWVCYKVGATQ